MTSVTRDQLGAWQIRCNPAASDLAGFLDGARCITSWCVADNYRSRLMAAGRSGAALVLPATGLERGIWGSGWVTGAPVEPITRAGVRISVLPDGPLTDAELRAAGIDDLEVQRQAFGSNPSWVSRDQLARFPRQTWPDPVRGRG